MVKAIIFDLWNTLGTKGVEISRTLSEHFNLEYTPEFLVKYEKSIQLVEWNKEEEMAISFLKSFNLKLSKENISFVKKTLRSKPGLYDGMEELLKKLSRNYKLGILSNTTIFETRLVEEWNLSHLFDAQVYSWQIGSLKPAKKNFEVICEKLKTKPKECLFIDDTLQNIQAAKEYDMFAIQYKNVSQLKEELKKLGVTHD